MREATNKLLNLNVNGLTEKKGNLTYLSWAHAWEQLLKIAPDSTYSVIMSEGNLPYHGTKEVGYMVRTELTVGGLTRSMWLPVMDNRNQSLLNPKITDINRAIMRCLTKNISMFGLGLYIYSGEDLPAAEIEQRTEDDAKQDLKRKIMCAMENFSEEDKAAEIAKLRADPTLICFEHFQTLLTRREEIHLDMDDPIKFKQSQQMYKSDY